LDEQWYCRHRLLPRPDWNGQRRRREFVCDAQRRKRRDRRMGTGQHRRFQWIQRRLYRDSNLRATAATNTAFRGIALAPEAGGPTGPSITTQPSNKTISPGQTAALEIMAAGTPPLSYQWYRGASGDTANPIGGAILASFTTPALFANTSYWVRVSNTAGSVDSTMATVTVEAPVCSAAFTPIHNVQGSGETNPMNGMTVTIRGVVVGDYEGPSPALRGFGGTREYAECARSGCKSLSRHREPAQPVAWARDLHLYQHRRDRKRHYTSFRKCDIA
jgi:hypothetical protein